MFVDKRVPIYFIFSNIKFDLVYVFLVGLVVQIMTNFVGDLVPDLPLSIAAFLGTAISILLSFKMSQSYDRWWEARKVWGAIVNDSRSFVLQMQTFLLVDDAAVLIRRMSYRQIAWCYSLGQSLRKLDALENMGKFMSDEDIAKISVHSNRPLGIVQLNALDIKKLKENKEIDGFTHIQLDNTLVRFVEAMGKAERINNTIFPTTYRLFLHFTIYLFVVILSIALKDVNVYYVMPLLIVISLVFFLLERTATQLQDPFSNSPSDTPVTAIARTIEINIRQLLGEEDLPKPVQPSDFYIM